MRILIIHNYYQQYGGERVAVENQIALLREQGHEVILYTRDNGEILGYGLIDKVLFFLRTIFSRKTFKEIKGLVEEEKPDLAHVHNVFPLISPSVYQALTVTNVPIIQTIHNYRFLCPNGLFYTNGHLCERCKYGNTLHAILRKCYRKSYLLSALYAFTIAFHRNLGTFQIIDRLIALTDFTAHKLIESGLVSENKISILGNYLHDPLPNPGCFEKHEPYIVYLGRLSPEKGVRILINAMSGLPDLELRIAGEGPQAKQLELIAIEKGLQNVKFLGHVSGNEKWNLLRHASAVVIPSVWYEIFGLVALESMAVGTPVIASDLGGLSCIIEDNQSGLLFYPGERDELYRKISWIVNHPQDAIRLGSQGRSLLEKKYSADAHFNHLVSIYEEVVR
jgi:glycosyltransferase involved in cell wall biosynthesis